MDFFEIESNTKTRLEDEQQLQEPCMKRVLLHNDDYTTMEFVINILEKIFHKSPAEATVIMLNVHHNGIGICGVYPADIAETKVSEVHREARQAGFPLKASTEPV